MAPSPGFIRGEGPAGGDPGHARTGQSGKASEQAAAEGEGNLEAGHEAGRVPHGKPAFAAPEGGSPLFLHFQSPYSTIIIIPIPAAVQLQLLSPESLFRARNGNVMVSCGDNIVNSDNPNLVVLLILRR